MRVGLVAKGLLLKGDLDLELVLLCKDKPTSTLLKKVAENLSVQLRVGHVLNNLKWNNTVCIVFSTVKILSLISFQLITEDKYEVMQFIRDACIMIKNNKQPALNLTIHLTSPVVREEAEKQATGGTFTLFRDKKAQRITVPSKPANTNRLE